MSTILEIAREGLALGTRVTGYYRPFKFNPRESEPWEKPIAEFMAISTNNFEDVARALIQARDALQEISSTYTKSEDKTLLAEHIKEVASMALASLERNTKTWVTTGVKAVEEKPHG